MEIKEICRKLSARLGQEVTPENLTAYMKKYAGQNAFYIPLDVMLEAFRAKEGDCLRIVITEKPEREGTGYIAVAKLIDNNEKVIDCGYGFADNTNDAEDEGANPFYCCQSVAKRQILRSRGYGVPIFSDSETRRLVDFYEKASIDAAEDEVSEVAETEKTSPEKRRRRKRPADSSVEKKVDVSLTENGAEAPTNTNLAEVSTASADYISAEASAVDVNVASVETPAADGDEMSLEEALNYRIVYRDLDMTVRDIIERAESGGEDCEKMYRFLEFFALSESGAKKRPEDSKAVRRALSPTMMEKLKAR